jgi:hypothetical protein
VNNRGRPSGFRKLADPVMAVAVRRSTERDLRRLQALLER